VVPAYEDPSGRVRRPLEKAVSPYLDIAQQRIEYMLKI
jgi:hypothetical protein